jgi:hypothetical protein
MMCIFIDATDTYTPQTASTMYDNLVQMLGAHVRFFIELVEFFGSLMTTNAPWYASSSFYLLVVGAAI